MKPEENDLRPKQVRIILLDSDFEEIFILFLLFLTFDTISFEQVEQLLKALGVKQLLN